MLKETLEKNIHAQMQGFFSVEILICNIFL